MKIASVKWLLVISDLLGWVTVDQMIGVNWALAFLFETKKKYYLSIRSYNVQMGTIMCLFYNVICRLVS